MNCAIEARKLANFIVGMQDSFLDAKEIGGSAMHYNHIGALYTDVILQAGLNYANVVKPRVKKVLLDYPDASTCILFYQAINKDGLQNIINWKDPVKLQRIISLLDFSLSNDINCCFSFRTFLSNPNNQKKVMSIKGIGPKTTDYLLKLLSFDTVAVDRHIYSFVQMADIDVKGYHPTKKVVEYAADLLNIPRSAIDRCIWQYMSVRNTSVRQPTQQLALNF